MLDRVTGAAAWLETRFDYWALAPAAAALCYPFLLKGFHAVVGTAAVTSSPLAILGAVAVLAVAFVVPFLGLALAIWSQLAPNPAVEINVIDMFQRRGYRFKGSALILPPGDDEYLMIADWVRATNGLEYPVDHVVKIDTASITPLLSPAHVFAHPPRSQDEIRTTYYQKYGVKPIGA
jgi:hypothetical protein